MPIIATYNPDEPSDLEKKLLISLVYTSSMDKDKKEEMMNRINNCTDYGTFERLQYELEANQQSIYEVINPSQADINNHLRRLS